MTRKNDLDMYGRRRGVWAWIPHKVSTLAALALLLIGLIVALAVML